jgi:hypothetical protein
MTSSNQECVGTCVRCGGRMLQYIILWMVGPFPSPKCEMCGYEYHGPVMGEHHSHPGNERSSICLQ